MSDSTNPHSLVAADVAILTIRDSALSVLLIRRANDPFRGQLALPGGFVEADETVEQAAARELFEETGVPKSASRLDTIGVYSRPDRDPRRRVISVAYTALVPNPGLDRPGGDAAATQWLPVDQALKEPLAFDHVDILEDAVDHARKQLEYTTDATAFCDGEFTIAELRRVYEIVWQTKIDPGNFHRKVTRIDRFLRPTGETTVRDGGRPAALYTAGDLKRLPLPLSPAARTSA
ncbi:NUDIX hydrolase [Glycomyces algeriensis]|uniref:NUDIX hydrolase n=1 Tax=Glycomyces algeriensis TaxID=256037 RepID=A0A9W6LII8_9ACTN|nr:NUDIX domain-containing protein [Glycomyces algeriensis]MDA1368282.1 NUDIX domain-containing protein [Glycomyces algeriensis]MDR7351922.1 8-oxo-dGTP diphosphatase [Glycomyces algeriensis]GLI44653.1 NUDIX hydrolase [Glycomyces algeriensis]